MHGPSYTLATPENPPDAAKLFALVHKPLAEAAGLMETLNDDLKNLGSGWHCELEEEAYENTYSRVTPLRLTYQDVPSRPAIGVSSLLDLLKGHGEHASADPALVGSPGYKPGSLTRGDFGRVPVKIVAQGPPRSERSARGGRRPIVALLDTAVQPHPWLGPSDPDLTGAGFWVDARRLGWHPGPRLTPSSSPVTEGPHGRELGDQEGHGTFCAGLIRQIAPDARVLAVEVMNDDGMVYGDHVLNGLGWLVDLHVPDRRSVVLEKGDVVCLPFGFRPIWPMDKTYVGWLGDVLGELGQRGVLVVAAAGNDGEDDPVYPAAFAASAAYPETRLVSVGALNSNGRTRAEYSNYGFWVSDWEVGTSVVSTFPKVDGAARPELAWDDGRESADPDDFTGGFARWSGTSFAAAIYAGRYAQRKAVAASDAAENERA